MATKSTTRSGGASGGASRGNGNRQIAFRMDEASRAQLERMRVALGEALGYDGPATTSETIRTVLGMIGTRSRDGMMQAFLPKQRVWISEEVTAEMVMDLTSQCRTLEEAVSDLARQVQRIGTNVNQMARLGNEMKLAGRHFEIPEDALLAVRDELAKIARASRELSAKTSFPHLGWNELVEG